jgi:hypothetical protein
VLAVPSEQASESIPLRLVQPIAVWEVIASDELHRSRRQAALFCHFSVILPVAGMFPQVAFR